MEQGSKNLDEPELRPPEPATPLPCAYGCGFFGSPDTRDLCSKCFRDSLRSADAQGPTASSSSAAVPAEPDAVAVTSTKEPDQEEPGTRRAKAKAKSRCAACTWEEGGADGVRVPVRRGVLRRAPLLGQVRLRLRLQERRPRRHIPGKPLVRADKVDKL